MPHPPALKKVTAKRGTEVTHMNGCGFCQEFKHWWSQPFQADMSASRWALFIGLIIVLFTLWHMVFRHIKGFEA